MRHDRISRAAGETAHGKAANALGVRRVFVHENEVRWKSGPVGSEKSGPYVASGVYVKPSNPDDEPKHRSGRPRRRARARWARTPESTARHLAPRLAVLRDI